MSRTKPDQTKQLGNIGTIEVRDLASLKPNPLNPRGFVNEQDMEVIQLSRSIQERGLLNPISILRNGTIIAGHRRRLACRLAGLTRVRVIVQEQMSEDQQLELMLVENVQRQDLTCIQEAVGYKGLIDRGRSVAEIARAVGVPPAQINGRIVLLTLDTAVQRLFATKELPIGAAPILAKLDAAAQIEWARKAVGAHMSVEALKAAIQAPKTERATRAAHQVKGDNGSGGPVMTRHIAVESLKAKKVWPVPTEIFVNACERVSCACGPLDSESARQKACKDCPLAHFMCALVQEVYDTTH